MEFVLRENTALKSKNRISAISGLQRILRAVLHALKAQDTFRAVLSSPGIVLHIHFHGTHFFALAAGYTFTLVTLNPKQ